MADTELADLTEATTLAAGDLLYTVIDPAGTPLDRKVTHAGVFPQFAQIPASGDFLVASGGSTTTSNGVDVYEREHAVPIYVPAALTFTGIACYVDTLTASSVVRLGIRAKSTTIAGPGSLILDAGTVSSAATGAKEITISQALDRGWYWLTATMQAVTGARLRGFANTYASPFGAVITAAAGAAQATAPSNQVWTVSAVTGALAADPTWSLLNDVNSIPVLWLKR